MARTIEYMKRNEARIIMFLHNAERQFRKGSRIAFMLNIDYVYVMKLLGRMYDKGWLETHVYMGTTFYTTSIRTPKAEAKERLLVKQMRLKEE